MATTEQIRDPDLYGEDGSIDYERLYEGDFDDDEEGGESSSALAPLDSSSVSVSAMGRGDGHDRGRGYSEINAKEADVRFDALIDFTKNYVPKQHKTKMLINGLLRLTMRFLNAPALRRQLRFDTEEARAKYWIGRLGKDGKEHVDAADHLLDRWGSADLLMIEIRNRRIRFGLGAVEHERPRWYTALRKKALLEREAAKLPSAAYEYFLCRLEQYTINRERAEDRARGLPDQDYSQVITRINDGKATSAEIVNSMPWTFPEALVVAMQDAGDDNPHWNHYERMAANTALANSRRTRSHWGGRNEGGESDASGQ